MSRWVRGLGVFYVVAVGCATSNQVNADCDPAVEDCSAIDAAVGGAFPDGGTAGDASADAGPKFGFGEPCQDKGQCESNICILAGIGGICSVTCTDGSCPEGYGCFGVLGAIEPGQVADVCVPTNSQLCSPCEVNSECAIVGADQCLEYPDGKRFCAQDCSAVSCPIGYECQTVDVGGVSAQQCVPLSGACDCNQSTSGATEPCDIANDFGICAGARTCQGATGWGGCEPPSGTDAPDGAFIDDNCDGIDGDLTQAIFVATIGADDATCGLVYGDPCRTISHGIVRALSSSRGELYIQAGDYDEVVVLQNGIDLYGGYDASWQRDVHTQPAHRVRIRGGVDSGPGGAGEYLAVRARGLIVPTIVADLVIVGPDAIGQVGASGRSSYAVHAVDVTGLSFQRVTIEAGDGAAGQDGSNGANAANVNATAAMTGKQGGRADESIDLCDDDSRGAPGVAGTNSCAGTNGGSGGAGGTMDSDCGFPPDFGATDGNNGNNAASFAAGSYGYRGGGGGECNGGGPGLPGRVANGAAGSGASAGGARSGDYWRTAGGGGGGLGQHGTGGGGGGGSGGCDSGIDSYGAGGGGGGAGGCRADGAGGGGFGGGASFGVFAINSSVTIQGCDIVRGAGGKGGDGGVGGRGQSGGAAGPGGIADGDSKVGGAGAAGSHGGHGGGGGGGAGGDAVGIYADGSSVAQDCTFAGGGAGAGGDGGKSAPTAPVAERDGNDGGQGASGRVFTVLSR